MRRNTMFVALAALAVVVAFWAGRVSERSPAISEERSVASEREILYWVAPMDPNFRRDEPGKSPMGMDLVPVYADDVDSESGVIRIAPVVVNNLGVRTAPAQFGELARKIDTVGYVGYDEGTVQHVHTRVDGWVEQLAVTAEGDPVDSGQLLFELYSPTLVNAQEELLTAVRSGNAVLRNASRERLAALGVSASEIARIERERSVAQRVRLYAETDGVVARLGVRDGMFVTPMTEVMAVAELESVWVIAEVFERQAGWVKAGMASSVELDSLPGRRFDAVVDYVYPELDPETRTLRVRLRLDNPDGALKPNMFARVHIDAEGFGDVVHVPREAVIRDGRTARVVLALGDGRFRSQPISLGIESGDRIAVRRGLRAGDEVVVSAQFLIDSESSLQTAMDRMSSETGSNRRREDEQGDSQSHADDSGAKP